MKKFAKAGSLLPLLVVVAVGGIIYMLYKKFFGDSEFMEAAKALSDKQKMNSKAVQDQITQDVYEKTVNITISREQANTIANTVYYYLNSAFFTESDRENVKTLLYGLYGNAIRLVSEQFGYKDLKRFDLWLFSSGETYDLKGALIKCFGAGDFNAIWGKTFADARL